MIVRRRRKSNFNFAGSGKFSEIGPRFPELAGQQKDAGANTIMLLDNFR
jgi:hypothetical protein